MRVISVNVASLRDIEIQGRMVPTGIFKKPADGPQAVDSNGLRHDVWVEARKRGERDQALHAYPHEHYAHWREQLGRRALPLGLFGENLTLAGLLETRVRIGDVLRCGTAVLQIAHPRIPCRKLDARVGGSFKRMFLESRRVGYYLRVLAPGEISAGDSIERLESDPASPTVDEFVRISQFDYWDSSGLQSLLRAKDLSERWQDILGDKLRRAQSAVGWFGPRELTVVKRREEGETAASLYLRCAVGRPLPAFRPGQDLTVSMRSGPGGPVHRRAVALSNASTETSLYRITVDFDGAPARVAARRDPLSEFFQRARGGERIRATEPRGTFTLDSLSETSCEKLLFVSEGIGIASLVGMLYDWSRHHAYVPAILLHTGSVSGFQALKSEAEAIRSRSRNLTILAGASVGELFASELCERAIVFGVGGRRITEELQDACCTEGLDPTRLRIKHVAE